MCLGMPMRVRAVVGEAADCLSKDGSARMVSLALVGPQAIGAWVLVHIQTAIRVLDEAEAEQIHQALQAVEAVTRGESIDHLFADLIDREPQLPEHLRD